MRPTLILTAVLAAVLLASCSLFGPKFVTPKLSIIGIEMGKADLFQQNLKVRMRVHNPNDRVLPIKGLSYDLEVAGEPFAHGESDAAFTVPAMGDADFDMHLTANMAGAFIRLLSRGGDARHDPIAYHITGKVELSSGMLRSIPFDEHGQFNLK
ncbi:MAG TPA: LEA type 2 family protein [Steroidobacteraceae bacterium]|nr:LEA type 2 family protein [Steroidobacteraceae bacterium]